MTQSNVADQIGAIVRLTLPARPISASVARSVIRRIVTFRDADAESSFLIAFSEVMSNAIDEHERIDSNEPIRVAVIRNGNDHVTITDAGAGIDLTRSSDPRRAQVGEERGRGLALARAFVGDLSFEVAPSGTIATLPLSGLGIIR